MEWMSAAEEAHGTAVAAVKSDVARRYGEDAALVAEDVAEYVLSAWAEDAARGDARHSGQPALVTPGHVARAAAGYRYHAPTRMRIAATVARIAGVFRGGVRTA